jgi:hypothetical protein
MIRYDVDIHKQTVTATISGCQFDAVNYIERRIKQTYPNSAITMPFEMWNKCQLHWEYSGTVKCIAPDVFDIKTGKQLAREKAIQHYEQAFEKRLNIYITKQNQLYNSIITDWQNNKFTK